jgi:hypothetical protein
MLEHKARVGAPNFFQVPQLQNMPRGNGSLCSTGILQCQAFYQESYKFLPFVPNGINWVAAQGQDVISAPFSGCIMAAYEDGGVRKVCHVSTGNELGDCKATWNALKAEYSNVLEFRPSDFIENTPHSRCYGLLTADLKVYTILVDVKSVPLADGGRLFADEQFVKITEARFLQ